MNYYSTIAFLHFVEYLIYRYFYTIKSVVSLSKKTYLDISITNIRTNETSFYTKIVLQDYKIREKLINKIYDCLTVKKEDDEYTYLKFKEWRDENGIDDTDSYMINFKDYQTNFAENINQRSIAYSKIFWLIVCLGMSAWVFGVYITLCLFALHLIDIWDNIE